LIIYKLYIYINNNILLTNYNSHPFNLNVIRRVHKYININEINKYKYLTQYLIFIKNGESQEVFIKSNRSW
jgi:hypothetical protein